MILIEKYLVLYKVLIKSNLLKLILIFDDSSTIFNIIVILFISLYYLIINNIVNYIYINIFNI